MSLTNFPRGLKSFVIPKNATVCSASTLTAAANTTYYITATCVVTLPALATGNTISFINAGAKDGLVQITLTPTTGDGINLAASLTDNESLVNTLATAKRGDFVTLASANQTVYWFPTAIQGTWAKVA